MCARRPESSATCSTASALPAPLPAGRETGKDPQAGVRGAADPREPREGLCALEALPLECSGRQAVGLSQAPHVVERARLVSHVQTVRV